MIKQIKSKERVDKFSEVYTSKREVDAMLDLVDQETKRLDSRFLEPACGDGNFLTEVLERKIDVLVKKFSENQYEFEKNAILVIGSIYGVDILRDNAKFARKRLFNNFKEAYLNLFLETFNSNFLKSIKFIIKKNIINGDALTLKKNNSDEPLTFCEWVIVKNKIKRRDYKLSDLLAYAPGEKIELQGNLRQKTLFSDLGEKVIIPYPVNEYPLVNFDKAFEA